MGYSLPNELELDGRGRTVAVVVARFNSEITQGLLDGAVERLEEAGVGKYDIKVISVAGAFEIPVVAANLFEKGNVDGVIALGAVIRGGTPHFDYVCNAVTDGCLRVSLDSRRPVAFGVLTCDNIEQARERTVPGPDNKGREAAAALLEALTALDTI